jgi:hypothetical protein
LVHFISTVVLVATIVLGLVVVLKVLVPIAEANQALRGKPAQRNEDAKLKVEAVKYCTCGAKVPAGGGHCPDCGAAMPLTNELAGGRQGRKPVPPTSGRNLDRTGRPLTIIGQMQRADAEAEPNLDT